MHYKRRHSFHLSIVLFCVDYHSRNGTWVSHHQQGKKSQGEECNLGKVLNDTYKVQLFSNFFCQRWERVSNLSWAAGSSSRDCRPWLRDSSLFFFVFHRPLFVFVVGHEEDQPVPGQTRAAPFHVFSRLPVCWVQLYSKERTRPGKGWYIGDRRLHLDSSNFLSIGQSWLAIRPARIAKPSGESLPPNFAEREVISSTASVLYLLDGKGPLWFDRISNLPYLDLQSAK